MIGPDGADRVEVEPVRPASTRRRLALGLVAIAVVLALALGEALRGPGPRPAPDPAGPTSNPTAQPMAVGDRIAVVDPTGALSIVDRRGTVVQRFPVEGTTFRFPAFSPDGTQLAVVAAAVDRSGVFVFDIGSSAEGGVDTAAGASAAPPRAVFSSPDRGVIYFSWAPDGARIGFLTGETGGLALRVVPADGLGVDTVVTRGQPLYWDWLDPEHLFVHSGGTGPEAFIGDVDLDGVPTVAAGPSPGFFQSPAVSRDGRYGAYVAARPDGGRLVIAQREATGETEIGIGGAASFGWSPVADELAFIDGGGAAGPALGVLQVADAATGATRTLLEAPIAAFFWSPDGSLIAALSLSVRDGGNVASASGAWPGSIAAIHGIDIGLVVVDTATGERVLERLVVLSDLFEQQLLPFFDQYAKSHPIWSSDSRAIVLPLVDAEGGSHLTVIPVDGGPEVDLGPGVLGFWSP